MPARTGEQFLRGLRGAREIWVDGARVSDVVDHPALSGAAHALAEVFDLQHAEAATCLMPDPETGEPINVSHMITRSRADLKARHACLEKMADFSVGLLGRTPDYLNVTFAAFAGRDDEWAAHGNEAGAERMVAYQKHLRRNDLSLTHAIVQANIDKAKGDNMFVGDPIPIRKVADTQHGIVVRGTRVFATLAPFADEIACYPRAPAPEGGEALAVCFAIPMSTPGLKFICRDSMAGSRNRFDHPLSSRFDEQDAVVFFDDVEIPRERVFIDGNREAYNSVTRTSWMPTIMHQTMIRARVKLEFAWGLAWRMAEATNATKEPAALQMLGELWAYAEFTRSAILTAEAEAFEYGNGFWAPDLKPLFALRAMLPLWFPRVSDIIRLMGSHNLLATPRQADFADPELRRLIDTYLPGAGDMSAEQRARIFRLGWDFVGGALGSRNEQYERFYLASGARNLQNHHMFVGQARERAAKLVDRFLEEKL